MKHKNQYENLIGKTRDEVKHVLGDSFNHYQNALWIYTLKRDWLGRRKFLYIYFRNDMVSRIEIER